MVLHEALDPTEARILGVLVEKELTTPDGYPLSLNALVGGCNQKSNRDPLTSYDEQTVSEALVRLRLHHLVREVHAAGARVTKYEHAARQALAVDTPGLAVLAELLLRGPQTAGELRARVDRMARMEDLAALDAVLAPLAQRGLVVKLAPAPGSRAARFAQTLAPGLHGGGDEAAEGGGAGSAAAPHDAPSPSEEGGPRAIAPAPTSARGQAGGADLARRVADLEERIEELARRLDALGG